MFNKDVAEVEPIVIRPVSGYRTIVPQPVATKTKDTHAKK
jgi:ABC-type transporter lipoprotein component MlaA